MKDNAICAATLLVALVMLAGCGGNRMADARASVYVSPQGDDANPGTAAARPLRTPRAAVERMRELRKAGKISGDAVVEFADGTYPLAEPVRLGADDSGTTWRAAHRGKAVFTGTTKLVWRKLADAKVEALLPATARGKVMVAEVPGKGLLPSFMGGSHLYTPSNDIPLAVFCGEDRLACARWPNGGFARTGAVQAETIRIGQRAKKDASFAFDRDKLAQWTKEPFAWTFGLWGVEWADATYPLSRIDVGAGTVSLPPVVIPFGLRRAMPFYVLNAFTELDRPGEWVADRERRLLYLWPKEEGSGIGDQGLGIGEVVLCEGMIRAEGLKDFAFDGFVFEKTRKTAVTVKQGERVTVRASVFRHTCSWAVEIDGGRDCRVAGCDMYDLGEGGVRLAGGDCLALEPGGHVAENNHIHHYGRVFYNYRQGIAMYGIGNRAVHNLVHHSAHTGIYWSGTDNEIAYNVIHDTCEFNDDAGAIYVWHYSWLKRGGLIAHNVIHYTGKKRFPNATEGIYLDDYSSEVRVIGNLVNRASLGVHVGGGQSCEIAGNVLMNCGSALHLSTRMGWPDPKKGADSKILREVTDHLAICDTPSWRTRFPGLGRLIDFAKTDPKNAHQALWNTVTNNLGVGSGEFKHANWDAISNTTVWADNVSVTNDPGFADYFGIDWTARPDSKYRGLIDGCEFAKAGLYDDPERISPAVKFGDVTRPDPIGTITLSKPLINLAVTLQGELPAGVTAFAERTEGCAVTDWSKGRWIFAQMPCAPDGTSPWERISYSFVPTCDCTVVLTAMGGVGEHTLYDDIRIEGAEVDGPLFRQEQPFKANERQRVHSAPVRCRKGTPVRVFFRAKSAEGFERGADARKTVIEVSPGGRIGSLEAARDEIRAIRAKNGGRLPNRIGWTAMGTPIEEKRP